MKSCTFNLDGKGEEPCQLRLALQVMFAERVHRGRLRPLLGALSLVCNESFKS